MIKVTVNDILNSQEVFSKIAAMPIKVKTSFAIARIIRNLESELETFDKSRQALIKKYANKDENDELILNEDGTIAITPENAEEYNHEIQELLNSEITLAADPLDIKEIENIELTPTQVYMIEKFIKE